MVFVSKKQRQNLINFLNDANLHTFFYFLKNPLAYYNIPVGGIKKIIY